MIKAFTCQIVKKKTQSHENQKTRCLKRNEKQMKEEAANITRFVTRLRNIVERSFGRLKQWKILRNVIDTNNIPKLDDLSEYYVLLLIIFFTIYVTH